ncbi:MAG: DcrB-related protein [Myxococcaceae bacterium]
MPNLQHNALSLALPQGWEDGSQVIALGPQDGGFRPNLVFSQEPVKAGENSAQFAARQLPQLKQALTGYVLVKEGAAKFGNNSGFLREHAFKMEKSEIGQLQFYVVNGGTAFTFTFTHLKPKLAAAKPTAEKLFTQAKLGAGGGGSGRAGSDTADF